MPGRDRTWHPAYALGLLALITACNGGSPSPPAASNTAPVQAALSNADAARQLQAALSPVRGALARFSAQLEANATLSVAELQTDAAPLISALQTLQQQLGSTNWPPAAGQQVNALVLNVNALLTDLRGITGPASVAPSSAFTTHAAVFTQLADSLMRALGGSV